MIALLIVEVRSLRALAVYLDDAQSKRRDEMVTRGIRALRAALDRVDDDPRPEPLGATSSEDDDDEATVVRPRREDDDELTSPLSGRLPTWPKK